MYGAIRDRFFLFNLKCNVSLLLNLYAAHDSSIRYLYPFPRKCPEFLQKDFIIICIIVNKYNVSIQSSNDPRKTSIFLQIPVKRRTINNNFISKCTTNLQAGILYWRYRYIIYLPTREIFCRVSEYKYISK